MKRFLDALFFGRPLEYVGPLLTLALGVSVLSFGVIYDDPLIYFFGSVLNVIGLLWNFDSWASFRDDIRSEVLVEARRALSQSEYERLLDRLGLGVIEH